MPLSVVAGRADIMEQMFTGGVVFGGTFNGNPLSLSGADVCLDELSRNDGETLKRANHMGSELMEGIRESAKSRRDSSPGDGIRDGLLPALHRA